MSNSVEGHVFLVRSTDLLEIPLGERSRRHFVICPLEEEDRDSEIRPQRSQIGVEHLLAEPPRRNLDKSTVTVVYVSEREIGSAEHRPAKKGRFGYAVGFAFVVSKPFEVRKDLLCAVVGRCANPL